MCFVNELTFILITTTRTFDFRQIDKKYTKWTGLRHLLLSIDCEELVWQSGTFKW